MAGSITEGPEAEAAIRAGMPENALLALVCDLNAAMARGASEVQVPARIAGGRVGWSARCGLLRAKLRKRLSAQVRRKSITSDAAAALIARYGLEGEKGTALSTRCTSLIRAAIWAAC